MKTLFTLALFSSATPAFAAPNFAFDLYQTLAKEPGNLFFSPFSVSSALEMTSQGAKGATREEMRKTLRLAPGPRPDLGPDIEVANRLFTQAGTPFYPDFLAKTGAGAEPLHFHENPEAARARINEWVEERTHKKIQNLMPAGSITEHTDLVLANAVYFKGDWAEPFDKDATKPATFHGDSDAEKSFMHRESKEDYAEDDSFQALRLPYKGRNLAMTIFLPKPGKKLSSLTAARAAKLVGQLSRSTVRMSLPKFRVEYEKQLQGVLPGLGMKLAFTPKANFSGMRTLAPEEKLFISVVAHKAFVDVDENGTEAAAATGVAMMVGAAYIANPPPPKVFNANRAFLFTIDHVGTKTVVFMGRVSR